MKSAVVTKATEPLTKIDRGTITITVNRNELKKIMLKIPKESLAELLTDVIAARHDILPDIIELIEDIGLGRAMEEADTGEYIDFDKFMKKLDRKIKK